MNAPPSVSDRADSPAMFAAAKKVMRIVARRIRNPTVPAVAGSIRRKSSGPSDRPAARASDQPRLSITTTLAMRTGSARPGPKISLRCV
ncbi:MAG: hypothetical protein U0S48_08230 [Solirubrobacteraceae bacterium]